MFRISSIYLLILSVSLVHSQEKSAFTLSEAIDYAIRYNPNYLNAVLDQENAIYKKNEVRAMGFPQVSASADIKDYIEIPTSLIPGEFFGAPPGSFIPVRFGTKYNATAGINASQLVYSSDYIFGLKAAREFMNLSKIQITRTKADMIAQVTKAYYNVVINQERLKLLDANIKRLKKMVDDTRAFHQQGFVEKIDVDRLEVQYNNLLTEREKINSLIGLSENLLKFQMGYNIDKPITVADTLSISGTDSEISISSIADVGLRPEYQLLQTQQKLLDIDIKRNKWGYLPTLAAYGAYQYNAQRQEFNFMDNSKPWFKIALIGATVNLNIFDGFQRHNRIQQAKVAKNKNENMLKNMELAAQLEVSSAAISYQNALKSLNTQSQNKLLAQNVYEVAQKKYQQGVGSNLEVLNAETTLKEAETNYFNALYDLLVAKTDYLKATGKLTK